MKILGDCIELVKPRDVVSLVDTLQRLINDPERRKQMGEIGKRIVESILPGNGMQPKPSVSINVFYILERCATQKPCFRAGTLVCIASLSRPSDERHFYIETDAARNALSHIPHLEPTFRTFWMYFWEFMPTYSD